MKAKINQNEGEEERKEGILPPTVCNTELKSYSKEARIK